jgi:hypothetical protein
VPSTRRSFLGALASLAGVRLGAQAPNAAAPWDLSWLDGLKGKHRQVFSIGTLAGHQPLHVVTNWFDAHKEVFGLAHPDLNAVVGVSMSYPLNASDALWAKYELGRRWELKDPTTGEWAVRNIYLERMPAPAGKAVGVRELQARGAIFWQCNNALAAVASRLARETSRPLPEVRADLVAGLNPGVRLIPAHTMVLGLAQERGCTYEQIG